MSGKTTSLTSLRQACAAVSDSNSGSKVRGSDREHGRTAREEKIEINTTTERTQNVKFDEISDVGFTWQLRDFPGNNCILPAVHILCRPSRVRFNKLSLSRPGALGADHLHLARKQEG